MKRSSALLLALFAFLTATAFRFIFQHQPVSNSVINSNTSYQPKNVFRCSPSYVPNADETIPPLTGWGNYKWKVTTKSDSAQFYFNQGMAVDKNFALFSASSGWVDASTA